MQQVPGQVSQPAEGGKAMPNTEPKKMKWWMWLIIALVFIIVGVVVYRLIF